MRHKVINFPRIGKGGQTTKKRFRWLLPTDKIFRIKATFHEVKRSFVYSQAASRSLYENTIFGCSNDLDKGISRGDSFILPRNVELHDYSRIFLRGVANTDSNLFKEFIVSLKEHAFLQLHDFSQIVIELGVVFYDENVDKRATHIGWYNIIDDEENNVLVVGTLFYRYKGLEGVLKDFQAPVECSVLLTRIDKRDIETEKSYPWTKASKSFFENKHICYFEL